MGVIIAAILIKATGLLWVDPLVSILIGILILFGAYRVLRPTLQILIEGTPEGLSAVSVRDVINGLPSVEGVHDLHLWNICSGHIALSAHVVASFEGQGQQDTMMAALKERLGSQFGIEHTTIQFEAAACSQLDQYCL
jgi:cobalt-zinc-cadmium efflux system protein